MGGGTGTGGSAVIANAARQAGILTVGVVTKPFHFEGAHRMRLAEAGIEELQQYVDTLLIIPNQNLFRVANEKTTFADAFKMADEVLHSGVRGVTDLMVMPGLINLDFADIRAVMSEMGKAMMGTGEASGERRAVEAAEAAISNPLLEDASMQGAKGLLVNITGGMDMTLFEVDEAMNRIRDEVDPDANIIFGSTFSPELEGKIRVSVVATGIDGGIAARQPVGSKGATAVDSAAATFNSQFQGKIANPAFGRGVTLRTGTSPATNAVGTTQQTQQQAPTAPIQRTGTTSYRAQAQAMATNPGFYGRAAMAGAATARKIEEPMTIGTLETDSYAEPMIETQPQAETYMAPVVQQQQAQATAQRGERFDDAFIPPAPVMAAKPIATPTGYAAPAAPASGFAEEMIAAPQQRPQQSQQRPTAPVQQEKRQGGFFDRFTSGGNNAPAARAPAPQQPIQPTLTVDNSDRIAPNTSLEDDLEIPAFLRRQAN
jgi:cell division protein FtsZ